MPTFEELVAEAEAAPIIGWDFSWLHGRAIEDRPSWGYAELAAERLPAAHSVLDIHTGGGERLAFIAGLARLPARTVATESYRPNVPVAARRLAPLGVSVVADEDGRFPFGAGLFDLVLNRHADTHWSEIARVLRPGGTFLSQQVGGRNLEGLARALGGPCSSWSDWGPGRARSEAEEAGLAVIDLREELPRTVFFDVAAVVYFLRMVPWAIPGFTVAGYRGALERLHRRIGAAGPLEVSAHRFLIEARKPE